MMNWDECEHEWEEIEGSNDRFEYVRCKKCQCPGERDKIVGDVFWPAT